MLCCFFDPIKHDFRLQGLRSQLLSDPPLRVPAFGSGWTASSSSPSSWASPSKQCSGYPPQLWAISQQASFLHLFLTSVPPLPPLPHRSLLRSELGWTSALQALVLVSALPTESAPPEALKVLSCPQAPIQGCSSGTERPSNSDLCPYCPARALKCTENL